MVNLSEPSTALGGENFLTEIRDVLSKHQPELNAEIFNDDIILKGTIITTGPFGPFDSFKILAVIFDGFPLVEPFVWETGGRIEPIEDMHISPEQKICCLGVWEEWLIRAPDHSFESFLIGPCHSFFVSQSEFERTGDWPLGSRSHGRKGVVESFSDLLGVEKNDELVKDYLAILSLRQIKGHHYCPCGSEKRLRNCHIVELKNLQKTISSSMAKRMFQRLRAPALDQAIR